MNKKFIALAAALSMLVSSVSCGDTQEEKLAKLNDIAEYSAQVIDKDFVGTVSSDPQHCLSGDSIEYRKKIMEKTDVDTEWLVVADKGNIKVYYGSNWEEPASELNSEAENKNSLSQIYVDVDHKIKAEEAAKTTTTTTTTAATTKKIKTTTTTSKKSEKPPTTTDTSGSGNKNDDTKLKTGGEVFTIVVWNDTLTKPLLEKFKETNENGTKVNFINFGVTGYEASERYDTMFLSADDMDLYFCEADWAYKYINDTTKAAPLEQLGFKESDFSDQFAYTLEVGRANEGKNKGKLVGVSWQSNPGGFVYRSDLAKKYLSVNSPEEMQEKIADWDKFSAAALDISVASGGKVHLADSIQGMWYAYSQNIGEKLYNGKKPNFGEPCKKFAETAKTLWENGGVYRNAQWFDGWIPAGQKGENMGYFVSSWGLESKGYDTFFASISKDQEGKWSFCQGPSTYFWGGMWMLVNPATDNADEAKQFIHNATLDKEYMKEYALDTQEFINSKSVMKDIIDSGKNPNATAMKTLSGQDYYADLYDIAESINNKGLITANDYKAKNAFIDAVLNVYFNGGTYEETKAQAEKKAK